jgi:uncharacterized membrane protein YfcA
MGIGQTIAIPARRPTTTEGAAYFVPGSFNHTARFIGIALIALGVLVATTAYFGVMPKFDERFIVTTIALFAGALVSGLAGFAFSAVAGAILLQWLPPAETGPLRLVCSITAQGLCVAKFWHVIQWRTCAPYLAGGILGIPIGTLLLQRLNADVFAAAFGIFLLVYCTTMILRPNLVIRCNSRACQIAAGFFGGVTGGATAFPGAIPTMWCNARGLPKEQQRGIIQPYILVMQLATLVYFSRTGLLWSGLWSAFAWSIPAVLFGTLLGFALFNRVDEAKFKRITLTFLFVSGVLLAL